MAREAWAGSSAARKADKTDGSHPAFLTGSCATTPAGRLVLPADVTTLPDFVYRRGSPDTHLNGGTAYQYRTAEASQNQLRIHGVSAYGVPFPRHR